jgi:hypothetical protein
MLGLRGFWVRRERTGAEVEVEVICTGLTRLDFHVWTINFHASRAQVAVKLLHGWIKQ